MQSWHCYLGRQRVVHQKYLHSRTELVLCGTFFWDASLMHCLPLHLNGLTLCHLTDLTKLMNCCCYSPHLMGHSSLLTFFLGFSYLAAISFPKKQLLMIWAKIIFSLQHNVTCSFIFRWNLKTVSLPESSQIHFSRAFAVHSAHLGCVVLSPPFQNLMAQMYTPRDLSPNYLAFAQLLGCFESRYVIFWPHLDSSSPNCLSPENDRMKLTICL